VGKSHLKAIAIWELGLFASFVGFLLGGGGRCVCGGVCGAPRYRIWKRNCKHQHSLGGFFCHLVSPSGEANLILSVSFDLIGKPKNDAKRKITPFLWETRLASNAVTVMSCLLLLPSPLLT